MRVVPIASVHEVTGTTTDKESKELNPSQATQSRQPSSHTPKEGGAAEMLRDGSGGAAGAMCGGSAPRAGGGAAQVDAQAQDDDRAQATADAIRRMVDTWPPLTEGQRARLTLLLRPGRTRVADE